MLLASIITYSGYMQRADSVICVVGCLNHSNVDWAVVAALLIWPVLAALVLKMKSLLPHCDGCSDVTC